MKRHQAVLVTAALTTGVAALVAVATAPPASLRDAAPYKSTVVIAMPNAAFTPGRVDTTDLKVICGTTTASRRHVTEATKAKVYAEYQFTSRTDMEVDHLIPLAIGGSNDIKNLWPEPGTPAPGFHQKDVLEVKLHSLVCSRTLDVKLAQAQIAGDWYTAYLKYVKP